VSTTGLPRSGSRARIRRCGFSSGSPGPTRSRTWSWRRCSAAGRSGIEERLPLPAARTEVGTLARTPWEALTALTECGRVAELLGDEVVAQQIALLES
jgi:hypothetical protein